MRIKMLTMKFKVPAIVQKAFNLYVNNRILDCYRMIDEVPLSNLQITLNGEAKSVLYLVDVMRKQLAYRSVSLEELRERRQLVRALFSMYKRYIQDYKSRQ